MNTRLKEIHEAALNEISKVTSMEELQNIRNTYLSKKSELMQSMSKMKDLQGEERAKFGQLINSIKMDITEKVEEARKVLEEKKLQEKLAKEVVDFTLPSSGGES